MTFGFVLGKPPKKQPDQNIPIFYCERTDQPIKLERGDQVHCDEGVFSIMRGKTPLRCYFNTERTSLWKPKEPNPHIVAKILARRHERTLVPQKNPNEKHLRWTLL